MLNEKEKENIEDLLKMIPDYEVFRLANTVSQYMITPINRREAIDTIVLHAESRESIMQRKKISKEILFRYLHTKEVPSLASGDKKTIMERIIQYWDRVATEKQSSNHQMSQQQITQSTSNQQISQQQVASPQTQIEVQKVNELALHFANWFYSMLNQQGALGAEHFWQDCSMCLTLNNGMNSETAQVHNNAVEVVQLLYNTKLQHNLFFNPNVSPDGVKGKVDMHGLVLVLACGTLHQQDRCVGVFEQLFGLVRDPMADNNWKIKNTQLCLKSKDTVSSLPTLEEGSLVKNLMLTNSSQ